MKSSSSLAKELMGLFIWFARKRNRQVGALAKSTIPFCLPTGLKKKKDKSTKQL